MDQDTKNPTLNMKPSDTDDLLEQVIKEQNLQTGHLNKIFEAEKQISGTSTRFTDEYTPRILITGADKGIGRGIAMVFAEEGYDVAITYRSDKESAEEVQAYIKEHFGVRCEILYVDVQDVELTKNVIKEAIEMLGGIDVLINNAGITEMHEDFDAHYIEDMGALYETNFRGPIVAMNTLAKYWADHNLPGNIINISSIHADDVQEKDALYGALKAGLERATESYAYMYAEYGIRVNAIAPGAILIDRTESGHEINKMQKEVPLGRSGVPRDIAHAALFLASERASYITGITILVDGGKKFTMT